MTIHDGSNSVFFSGLILVFVGFLGPLSRLITRLIPNNIQASVSIGIGLLVAFNGFASMGLVVPGKYTVLSVGPITSEVIIAISAVIIISLLVFYQSKYASVLGMVWGTFLWWTSQGCWPTAWVSLPHFVGDSSSSIGNVMGGLLILELVILEIITLYGTIRALFEMAKLIEEDGPIIKGRFVIHCYIS